MRARLTTIVLILLSAVSLSAAVTTWKIDAAPGEHVGAIDLGDDLTATIFFSSTKPLHTRVAQYRDGRLIHSARIDGFAVNHVEPTIARDFFVGGSLQNEYTYRLIRVTGDSVTIMWDAMNLPFGIVQHDAAVSMSDDGSRWAAVVQRGDEVEITAGAVPGYAPLLRSKLQVRLEGPLFAGYDAEGKSVKVLSRRGEPALLAVAVRGLTYVIGDGADAVKAVLVSPYGGAHLKWQADARTLWVQGGRNVWSGFSVQSPLPGRGGQLIPKASIGRDLLGRDAMELFPIGRAEVIVDEPRDGAHTLPVISTDGKPFVAHRHLLPEAAAQAIVTVNPSGTGALILPSGTRSGVAHVRTF